MSDCYQNSLLLHRICKTNIQLSLLDSNGGEGRGGEGVVSGDDWESEELGEEERDNNMVRREWGERERERGRGEVGGSCMHLSERLFWEAVW